MWTPEKRARSIESNKKRNEEYRKALLALPYKYCSKCGLRKDRNEFNKNISKFDGLQVRCRTCSMKINREVLRNLYKERREAVLDKLGRVCVRCGFSDIRALQVDHVDGGGVKHHIINRGSSFHKQVLEDTSGAYQILCANCNWIKRSENKEYVQRIK